MAAGWECPSLPMLSFPMKESARTSFLGIKPMISAHYEDEPETFNEEIRQLDQLREHALKPSRDYNGCSLLRRYFAQLHLLRARFPPETIGQLPIDFVWKDAYMNAEYVQEGLQIEQASILYNIAALHSLLGCRSKRDSEQEMKEAITHFQCAAGAFTYLDERFAINHASKDLGPQFVAFYKNLMLGQAQECLVEKSLKGVGRVKNVTIAKLATRVGEYFTQSLRSLECDPCNVIAKKNKDWAKILKVKMLYFQALSHYYQGANAEENGRYGEAVSWYQLTHQKLSSIGRPPKSLGESVRDAVKNFSHHVQEKLQVTKKQNDQVYHEVVPSPEALELVSGADLVKPVVFQPTDPKNLGTDILARLVPMQAYEASSVYSEEKAELLRSIVSSVNEKNDELEQYLQSLNVGEMEKLHEEQPTVPDDVLQQHLLLQGKSMMVKKLNSDVQELIRLSDTVTKDLAEIADLKKKDQEEEQAYQARFGSRSPSQLLASMWKNADNNQQYHTQATKSNLELRTMFNQHYKYLLLLSGPLASLKSTIPRMTPMDTPVQDSADSERWKELLDKVEKMKQQRKMLVAQLRDQVNSEDITKTMVGHLGSDKDSFISESMKRHRDLADIIRQNLAAQDNILTAVTDVNAQQVKVRQVVQDLVEQQETMFKSLVKAGTMFSVLQSKISEGLAFYVRLHDNVSKLLKRVVEVTATRSRERENSMRRTPTPDRGARMSASPPPGPAPPRPPKKAELAGNPLPFEQRVLPPEEKQATTQQPLSHEQNDGQETGQLSQVTPKPATGGPEFTSPPVMPTPESLEDQLKELQRMQQMQMKTLGHSVPVPSATEVASPSPVGPEVTGGAVQQPDNPVQPVSQAQAGVSGEVEQQSNASTLLSLQEMAQIHQPTPPDISSLTPEANQALLNLQMLLQPPMDDDQPSSFTEPLQPLNAATEQQAYPTEPGPTPVRPPKPSHLQSEPVPSLDAHTQHIGQQISSPNSEISVPGSEISPPVPSLVPDQSLVMRTPYQGPAGVPPGMQGPGSIPSGVQGPGGVPPEIQQLGSGVPPGVQGPGLSQAIPQNESMPPQPPPEGGIVPTQMYQGPQTENVPPQELQSDSVTPQVANFMPPQLQQGKLNELNTLPPQMLQGQHTNTMVPPHTQAQQVVPNFNVPPQSEPYKAMSVFGNEEPSEQHQQQQQPISPPSIIPTATQPVQQVQPVEPVSQSSFINGDNTVTVNTLSRPITSPVQSISSVDVGGSEQRDVTSPVELHRELDQNASPLPNVSVLPDQPVLPTVGDTHVVPSVYPNYEIDLETENDIPTETRVAPAISSANEHTALPPAPAPAPAPAPLPDEMNTTTSSSSQPPMHQQTPSTSTSLSDNSDPTSSVTTGNESHSLPANMQQDFSNNVPPATIPNQSTSAPPHGDGYSVTHGPSETTELRLSHGIDTNLHSLPELPSLGVPPNFHGMNLPPVPLNVPVLSTLSKEITTSLVGSQPSLSGVSSAEVSRLEEEIERQKKQLDEQRKRLQQQEALAMEKTNQAENYRQQLALLQQQLGQLTSQQHKQEQEKVAASGQQAVLMQLLQQQQGMFSQQQAQIEKLSQVIESHQKEQQEVEIKHRQAFAVEQEQKSNLQSQVLSLTQETQRLQQQLQSQAQQYQTLQVQVYQYHTQIQERDKQLLAFRDQHREIVQKLEQKHQEKVSQLVHQFQELQGIVKKYQERGMPPSMQQTPPQGLPPPLQPIAAKQHQQQPLQAPLVPQQFQPRPPGPPGPPGTPQSLGTPSVPPSPATPLSQQPASSQQVQSQMRSSNYQSQGQIPTPQSQIPMLQGHIPMSQQQHPNMSTSTGAQWMTTQQGGGQQIQRQTSEQFVNKQQQQQQQLSAGGRGQQPMIPSHSQAQPMLPSQVQQQAASHGPMHIPSSVSSPSLGLDMRRQGSPYIGGQRQPMQAPAPPPGGQMNPQTMAGPPGSTGQIQPTSGLQPQYTQGMTPQPSQRGPQGGVLTPHQQYQVPQRQQFPQPTRPGGPPQSLVPQGPPPQGQQLPPPSQTMLPRQPSPGVLPTQSYQQQQQHRQQ